MLLEGISGVSDPTDGAKASGEGPDQERRGRPKGRKRWRNRQKRKPQNDAVEHPSSMDSQHAERGDESKNRSGSTKNGSRNVSANAGGQVKTASASNKPLPLYAALDLGTNNCRLLIAVPQQRGRFRVVDGFSRIVRLGEGLGQTGRLSDQAMDRAVEALKICATKLKSRDIRSSRLIATEACRKASNGEAFLARVREETGLELEIVSGEMEARLAAEGCGSLMDRKSDGAVLFDIGGGSSELVLVDSTDRSKRAIRDRIVGWTSLPLGVVTLAEKFGGRDVTQDLFANMVDHVSEEIEKFAERNALDKIFNGGNAHLLGTSGTVTTLAGIHLRLPRYDRRQVDGLWMEDREIDTIINELLGMAYEERAANPCIGTERADLVLAGCAILNAIRAYWPAKRLRVADRGLREGLLTEMMHKDRSWQRPKKSRWSRKRRMKRSAPPAREVP